MGVEYLSINYLFYYIFILPLYKQDQVSLQGHSTNVVIIRTNIQI